jgi:glycine/D-amino acid oxidase-like deaminating enzyme
MKPGEQKQPHTASYYAATANWASNYPELEGGHEADVCVIGAGFTGIATALTLAESGYSVAVVEANRVGWGASGRNGGQLIHGISGDRKLAKIHGPEAARRLYEMQWRGHDIIYERVEKYGIDCDLKGGYIEVGLKQRHVEDLLWQYDNIMRNGHPYELQLLDREETRAITGTQAYIGGLLSMRNGHLHPLNLCLGEARAAEGLGARIFEQSTVTGIEHGERPRVVTDKGSVTANAVVLAGNAYSMLEPATLGGVIFPAGGYIVATEPLSEELRQQLNPRDLAVCDSNEVVDYHRLSADGRMLYGARCNYSGREPRSIKAAILPSMLKIYPALKGVRIDYEWGGKMGIVVNRIPALGRIRGNVYYAQGYSGHGVNATHILGEIVAEAIMGTLERFDLFGSVKHIRIPGGRWFGNQMVALGMIYYRIKDALS